MKPAACREATESRRSIRPLPGVSGSFVGGETIDLWLMKRKPGRPPREYELHEIRAELWTEQAAALHQYAKQRRTTVVKLLQEYTERLTGVPASPLTHTHEQEGLDLSA